MKSFTAFALLVAALYMSLCFGWTYAMTVARFPVEGLVGALIPVMCVLLGMAAVLVLQSDKP